MRPAGSVTPLFVAIGEILVDFTPIVEAEQTVGFRMHAGGSPCNVAVALARAGARVEFAGKASEDVFGQFLVEYLRQEGVGTRFLTRSPAPSTLAFVALAAGEPSFAFYGEGAADTRLRPGDLPDEITSAAVLHFGSISLIRGETATTIAGLVGQVRGRTILSCDPNIRPSLVRDAPAYRRLLMQLLSAADIVKISEADARWLVPDRPAEDVGAEIHHLGPALVVVTQGARGATALTAQGRTHVSAPQVRVVDTVGAGDAFTAGLLFALARQNVLTRRALDQIREESLSTALRFAAAAAALTSTRAGADPPRLRETEEFLTR